MMISENPGRRLLGLFVSYFKIASFTLGGGMVMLPLMEDEFVRKRKWLTSGDFMGVVTLINTLPGVIAVNSSIIIGRKVAGIPGAVAALLGGMVPSILIILLLAPAIAAIRGVPLVSAAFISVRSGVAALILMLIIRQAVKMNLGFREMVLSAAALIAVRIGGLHPILVIPAAALIGFFLYFREEKEKSD
jgi:chromate transporter